MTKNDQLTLALIGYGKMGRELEALANVMGYKIGAIIDNEKQWIEKESDLKQCDVALEFTVPSIVINNLKKLMELGIPVVTGTTGWMHQLPQIEQYCRQCNASLFYASNFSVGVNVFFAINRYLARLMNDHNTYRIRLEETHHTQKLDAPSGTAMSMINDIVKENKNVSGWKFHNEDPGINEIEVWAHRIEDVTGIHKLVYSSDIDTLTIEHNAHNRKGFAQGALMAAQWLPGKKGVFTMNDLLKI